MLNIVYRYDTNIQAQINAFAQQSVTALHKEIFGPLEYSV